MVSSTAEPRLPVIDLSLFDLGDPWRDQVAAQVDAASSEFGSFCLVGHGIDLQLVEPLLAAGRRFFSAEDAVKRRTQMASHRHRGQRDFALVEELVARGSDSKSLRFEARLVENCDPAKAGKPESAQSVWADVAGLREPVLDYMRSLTGLSHKLMAMVARGLHLRDSYFVDRWTGNPATSFRILNHPQFEDTRSAKDQIAHGHTDPGLLTILKQDSDGGLELNYRGQWIELPALPNSFICSVGQALAHLTNRRYAAAAHRLGHSAQADRLSMSFCFEAALNAKVAPIAAIGPAAPRAPLSDAELTALREPGHRQIG